MKEETYQELKALLQEFCEERDTLQRQMDDNIFAIHESETIAHRIMEKSEKDFDIFSPRKNREIHRDELEQSQNRKKELEEQNILLAEKRDRLSRIIDILQRSVEESGAESEEPEEDSPYRLSEDLIQTLDHVVYKIELGYQFISQDPVRAKQELEDVVKNLRGIVGDVEQ